HLHQPERRYYVHRGDPELADQRRTGTPGGGTKPPGGSLQALMSWGQTAETVSAWIESYPVRWVALFLCVSAQRSGYLVLSTHWLIFVLRIYAPKHLPRL